MKILWYGSDGRYRSRLDGGHRDCLADHFTCIAENDGFASVGLPIDGVDLPAHTCDGVVWLFGRWGGRAMQTKSRNWGRQP